MVPSSEPEIMVSPFGLNTTHRTQSITPCIVFKHSPVLTSHSFMVPSLEYETRVSPLGLTDILNIVLLCPMKVAIHSPERRSHTFIVLSSDFEVMVFLLRLTVILSTNYPAASRRGIKITSTVYFYAKPCNLFQDPGPEHIWILYSHLQIYSLCLRNNRSSRKHLPKAPFLPLGEP
jgi:hypothetical protein